MKNVFIDKYIKEMLYLQTLQRKEAKVVEVVMSVEHAFYILAIKTMPLQHKESAL